MAPDEPSSRLPALGRRGQGWVAGQMLLVFLEGVVSAPALAAMPPRSIPAWISAAGGVGLMLVGAWTLVRGMRALGANLSACPMPLPGGRLVQTGVYAEIRHPIYAGVVALAVGWAFLLASLPALVVAALLAVWHDLKARREEAWLVERLPGYDAYRRRTSRFVAGLY